MARQFNRLRALDVERAKPGMHADGGGLYLQVSLNGAKSWIFRYTVAGKTRDMGLGSTRAVTLKLARDKAAKCREQRAAGLDPIAARNAARDEAKEAAAKRVTFREAAEAYITAMSPGWRNGKHAQQWRNTLTAYAYPVFGDMVVSEIDNDVVLQALRPIWTTKNETASRVRGRVELILDAAAARGQRLGENPARWRVLKTLLPPRHQVKRVRHHPALPYSEMPCFMAELRAIDSTGSRALEFTVLAVARTSETTRAIWSDVDLENATWTVPPERIKAGREHRVPLPPLALAVLRREKATRPDAKPIDFVFSVTEGKPISNGTMSKVLKTMGRGVTVHGFRSSFSDWRAEVTAYPSELAEMALAHAVGDKVEAAYRRGDMFAKRRRLLEDWAAFCEHGLPDDNVVAFARVPAA